MSAGMVCVPQHPHPVRARSPGLLTKLPPLLVPDCDSLRAIYLEPLSRLPRILGVGVTPPLYKELALPVKPPLLEDPLHVVVGRSITIKERRRRPRTTTRHLRRVRLRGAPLVRVRRLRDRRRSLKLIVSVNESWCLRLHWDLGLAVMLPPSLGIEGSSLALRTA
ncbi:hypothetical protein Plhal710r2_c087g0182721 [Plasmopara halstedii]